MLNGLDVSSYQDTMDFSGYDFVIIKSSEGWNSKDPGMDRHINSALETNTPFGLYHYARPDLGNSAETEAASFIDIVSKYIGKAVLALDWEQLSLNYPVSWALEWLNYVYENTGVKPLLYIQASQAIRSVYSPIAKAGYGLWVAQWEVDEPQFSNWSTWSVWQYRGEPLDLDYFNGTVLDWEDLAGGSITHEWISKNNYLTEAEMENNARIIYDIFSAKGWTVNAIAGMLGNMQRESTLSPGIWEGLQPYPPGGGYGLVGWTPYTRITDWLISKGYAIDSGDGQCAKIIEEWEHPEIESVWIPTQEYPESFNEFVLSEQPADYLAAVFCYNYERAGVVALEERKQYARNWYSYLTLGYIYTPRLNSDGMENNPYWYDENPFYTAGYGLPNCTCYVWGRWYEILKEPPDLPLGNANTWYDEVKEKGTYKLGSTPQLGSIICTWYLGDGGHVAVVEQINDDGSIVTSNSGYGSDYFWIETLYPPNYLPSWVPSNAYVQGFIYLPTEFKPGPGPAPDPGPILQDEFNFIYYLKNPLLNFLK